ncbi:MAG: T9SS type A sorting domain-containing protein [Chitinophagaceae bacterium]|nr:T9SS type A sorting domain-containing protein [Chitinophagaceae bacterium]
MEPIQKYMSVKIKFFILFIACITFHGVYAQSSYNDRISTEKIGLRLDIIDVYPNPSIDHLIIQMNTKDVPIADLHIELHSIIGNNILTKIEKISDNIYKINTKDLSQGYYFLFIKSNDLKIKKTIKFLKN